MSYAIVFKTLLYTFGTAFLSFLWFYFLTPIHISITHSAEASPVVLVDGEEKSTTNYSRSPACFIIIQNASLDDSVVELALPIPDGAPRLKIEQLDAISDGWVITHDGERIESRVPGSRIAFTIDSAEPLLPFLQRPDGGKVFVSVDNVESEFNLTGEVYEFRPIRIPPREVVSVSYAGTPATISNLSVEITDSKEASSVLVNVGGGRLLKNVGVYPSKPYEMVLGFGDKLLLVARLAMEFWRPALIVAFLIFLFSMVGRTILHYSSGDSINKFSTMIAFTTGVSSFALLVNTLSYFFSVDSLALLLGVLLFLAACLGAFCVLKNEKNGTLGYSSFEVKRLAPGFVSVWLSFWPVSFVGSSYLGLLQTDSFFYPNVANVLQERSLFEYIELGGLIGHGLRSIDLSLAAALASVGGLPTNTIWLILCMLFMFIPPVVAYEFVLEWRNDKRVANITAWVVAVSAPMASLFFESYFAQFLLTGLLYLNLLCGLRLYHSILAGSLRIASALPFMLSSAVIALLYPYFAVLTFVSALVILFYALRLGQAMRIMFYGIGIMVFANIGIIFLFNHEATIGFTPALNAIAKNVVFPFYNDIKFPSFIFGFAPFHGSEELFLKLSTEFGGSKLLHSLAGYVRLSEGTIALILVGLIGIAYFYTLLPRYNTKFSLSGFDFVLPASLVIYVLLMAFALKFSGVYAFAKLSWTFATLLPLMIIPNISSMIFVQKNCSRDHTNSKFERVLFLSLLGIFFFANVISKTSASLLWASNPNGAVTDRYNTVVSGDLLKLSDSINAHKSSVDKLFAFSIESGYKPDQKALVKAAHTYSIMHSNGYSCVNCVFSPQLLDFRGAMPIEKTKSDASIIWIRFDGGIY